MKRLAVCLVLLGWASIENDLSAQPLRIVGAVASNVFRGETLVRVNWFCRPAADQSILLEAREGRVSESGEVQHVLGDNLILKSRLDHAFLAGSRLYQSAALADCPPDIPVVDKQAPIVACRPATFTLRQGESRTLQVSASDPDGDSLTYAWIVDGQSVPNNQPSFQFGTVGRSLGPHGVAVSVTDGDGMSAGCDFTVMVEARPNQNPTVALILERSELSAGETVRATAQASDPDGDPLTYSWKIDARGRPETTAELEIDTTGFSGGRHSASVTVRDDRDGSASDTQPFSVSEKIVIQNDRILPDNVAKARLDEIALRMQQGPQLRAVITGHTDDQGDREANLRIGQRRADAFRDYLVKEKGIDASRLEARSSGQSAPVADNRTPQGRKENRRVVVDLFAP